MASTPIRVSTEFRFKRGNCRLLGGTGVEVKAQTVQLARDPQPSQPLSGSRT